MKAAAVEHHAETPVEVDAAAAEPISTVAELTDNNLTASSEWGFEKPVESMREWIEEIPEPVAAIAEPIVEVEKVAEVVADPEPLVAAPVEPREPRDRFVPLYVPQPVFIDAPAATAKVQEAIAQIEALVAREALAAETIAKIEADHVVDNDTKRTEAERLDDADMPEELVELDVSTWLDDEAETVESTKTSATEDASLYESSEFDDEGDVYDINAIDGDPLLETLALIARQERQERREAPPALPAQVAAFEDHRAVLAAHTPSPRAQARQKPIQDEWGFFDPEQCGFAALLAKLDEILETDDRSA